MKKTFFKILLAVVAMAITAFYFINNPAETNVGFQCIFNKATGLYCPGCGGQRAFHALLHGNFQEAFSYNLLIFLVIPLVGIKFYEEIFEKKIMPKFLYSHCFLIVLVVLLVIFSVFRNLPYSFL